MAEANPSLNSNYRNPRNQIERLQSNAKHLKQEINYGVDTLIASIDNQRMELLNQVDSELHKAIEPLKNFENKNAARVEAKEQLSKQLKGDHTLLRRLTSEIDEELGKMEVDLPNFKIQWNPKFFRFCEDFEKVGQLKVDKHSRREDFEKVVQLKVEKHSRREDFEKVVQLKVDKHSRREDFEKVGELKVEKHSRREDFEKVVQLKVEKHSRREDFEKVVQLKVEKHSRREDFEKVGQLKVDKHSRREDFEKVGELKVEKHSRREDFEKVVQLKVDKHSQREASNTPRWTLNKGKADNEIGEPKAIAIDLETSNIYVGDASKGKILVMNRMGEYLNTLTFKKPSSISRMMICQNHIYCRTNNIFKTTLYRLDKNTGELLSKYNNIADIHDFAVLPGKIFLCDMTSFITLLPDLSRREDSKLISPYLKVGSSLVITMRNVGEELVMVISKPTNYPIQIFDQKGTFLRAIAEDIPSFNDFPEVYICIDKHWNIILSIDERKLNIYNKDGKFLTSVGQRGDEKSGIYQPRGIALDRDENLVVCNNRKQNILQANKMTS